MGVSIANLSKAFMVQNEEIPILDNVSLDIRDGEFVTIVGHSGCGKSSLLKIIAGLVPYSSGSVEVNGKRVTGPDVDRGMVFQEHRLLPWLTVKDNIGFGLTHLPKEQREGLITKYMQMIKLDGFGNAYPHQLSGGMAQRASIARGLVANPSILLLDEPFGALDALTRIQMQQEILRIWEEARTTMILVTHDIDEAIYLGSRVIVLSSRPGRIVEVVPVELARPRDRGSSDFAYIKKKIYSHFFTDEPAGMEFAI
ncbi:MAG: transporter related [Paenibacillaceae bacterium]|jgi:ABC-type nitrate/sulfonate/bicarbonate transport system ATPase subunit|nr:transporter related [Paenibacillaceae bacterium]